MKEGPVMKGGIVAAESLANRPAPPAPNKMPKQERDGPRHDLNVGTYHTFEVVKVKSLIDYYGLNTTFQPDTDPASEWQSGYDAGIEAAANALEADARLCDCFAHEENECACGSWADYKTITSARAVEIVRNLTNLKRPSP